MRLPSHIGRFRILRLVGQGAMGVVYRGRDDALEREVAIKVMSAAVLGDQDSRDRFLREARASARLQHPNIVTIYELGEHEGMPFMALELLEGLDLQRAIEAGIRPDPKITLPIVLQLLAGLGHAHDHGIIHRDVKPSNVFLPHGRAVKIMDFGVARMGGAGMATQGMVVGTPTYMSPEQVKGGHLDGRSDLFSAGLILYELVTGEKCLRGNTVVELLYKVVHEDRDLSALPVGRGWDGLRQVLTTSLQREPETRYANAQAMSRDLQQALRELGGSADWTHASDLGLLLRTPRPRSGPPTLSQAATSLGTPGPERATLRPAETHPQPTDQLPRPTPPLPTERVRTAVEGARPAWLWPAVGAAATVVLVLGLWRLVGGPARPSPSPSAPTPPALSPSPVPTPEPSPTRASPRPSPSPSPSPSPAPPSPSPSAGESSPRPLAGSPSPSPPPLEPSPSPSEAPANPRLERAEKLLEEGRFAAALAEARAILERDPRNPEAREIAQDAEAALAVEGALRKAREALARGDKDDAIDELKKGLSIKPSDARLLELWRQATQ